MGMAALAPMATQGHSVRGLQDYQQMGIWRLRELARQSHEHHTDEATRVFVTRILDMEVERRTLYAGEHLQGYASSSIAPGYAPGGTDIAREPLATLYDRGIRYHEAHEQVRRWLAWANIPDRQLLAALIQARKLDRRKHGTEWAASYEQIAARLGHYAQQLGFAAVEPLPGHSFDCIDDEKRQHGTVRVRTPHHVPAFKDGKAITNAATQARAEMILLAKSAAGPKSNDRDFLCR